MKKEETFKCLKDTLTGSYKAGVITDNPLCAYLPEYFGKYKFTTKDAVDKYMNDHYFRVFPDGNIWPCIISDCDTNADFSTSFDRLEAAQAYLDEQNKPKFEVGDFVKWSGYNTAFGRITEEASGNYFKLSLTFDETTSETHNSCHYQRG